MKKYRVREGSIADWMRIVMTAAAFWTVFFWAMLTTYPM